MRNPEAKYTCDPVMGSSGRFYVGVSGVGVSAKYVDLYRDKLLPLADAITPNQFE